MLRQRASAPPRAHADARLQDCRRRVPATLRSPRSSIEPARATARPLQFRHARSLREARGNAGFRGPSSLLIGFADRSIAVLDLPPAQGKLRVGFFQGTAVLERD